MTLDLLQTKPAYLSFFIRIADQALLSVFVRLALFENIHEKVALRLVKSLDVDLAIDFFTKVSKPAT